MTSTTLLGLLLGLGFAASLAVGTCGLHPRTRMKREGRRLRLPVHISGRRWLASIGAGTLSVAVTGWAVAGLLTIAGCLALPRLLGPDRAAAARTSKLEAVAVWAEMLRDTLSAAAGLEQAITATASVTPPALRDDVARLVERIEAGQSLGDALRAFADDVDDATCDMVTASLILAAESQARQLGSLLGQLAQATREQVTMRLKIEAGRSRVRTSVRVITGTTLSMAGGLVVLNRRYLDPFGTVEGQLALTVVGGLFAFAFWWLAKIGAIAEEPRVLKGAHSVPSGKAALH
ncbi:type II secretion system F family protein [Streptomyces triticagri]|nr:type II secretion system F family protein [Streptomyces triticagri]